MPPASASKQSSDVADDSTRSNPRKRSSDVADAQQRKKKNAVEITESESSDTEIAEAAEENKRERANKHSVSRSEAESEPPGPIDTSDVAEVKIRKSGNRIWSTYNGAEGRDPPCFLQGCFCVI